MKRAKPILVFLVLLLAAASYLQAQTTYTWNGSDDFFWSTPENWTPSGPPTAADDVIIPSGTPDKPYCLAGDACNSITFNAVFPQSATIRNYSNLTITSGTVTYNRYITCPSHYHYLSSPVSSPNTWGGAGGIFSDEMHTFVRSWDEPSQMWVNHTNAQAPAVYKGYSFYSDGDAGSCDNLATFVGTPVLPLPAKTVTIVKTLNTALSGFNLIGNPFLGAINCGQIFTQGSQINNFIYIYDGVEGGYDSFSNDGDPGNDDFTNINPCQGFFVQRSGGAGSGTFTYPTAVYHQTDPFLKNIQEPVNYLYVRVNGNETFYSDAKIMIRSGASAALDPMEDGHFLGGDELAPQLYSMTSDNYKTMHNVYPPEPNTVVPLGFYTGYDDSFTMTFSYLESFPPETGFILEDLKTGTTHNLRDNPEYTFAYTVNDDPDRFLLHIDGLTGIDNPVAHENVKIITTGNQVNIHSNGLQGEVMVYNMVGQQIHHTELAGGEISFTVEKPGIYIVNIISEDAESNHKIYIH
ncbi:MAG: T9SS type A sorting domain-containing protein [Bacteroidetes bacterium]|nr:T9SS type A sorting domain-containing protein [Bacteroidota bacterium]